VEAGLKMNAKHTKQILTMVFIVVVLSPLALGPSTNAISFNYSDNFLSVLSVSSSADLAKPLDTILVNVTGRLAVTGQSVIFHVTYTVDTTSQPGRILNAQDLFLSSSTVSNSALAQLIVPLDALNNAHIYASIGNGTIVFSKIPITLVQNPSYSDLQAQVNSLSATINSLQSNNGALQQQLNSLQNNNTNLQNQLSVLQTSYNNLLNLSQSDKASLLVQINNLSGNNTQLSNQIGSLQTQVNTLNSENSALQTQINDLQANNTNLQSQLTSEQDNNSALQTQISNLQSEKNGLLNQTALLQVLVANLNRNITALQTYSNILSNQSSNLQSQLTSLQSEYASLQSTENTTSILMYLATFVAVVFIVATVYIIFIVVRSKGKKNGEIATN
jgi:predicted nuclease with TOPRIM domain